MLNDIGHKWKRRPKAAFVLTGQAVELFFANPATSAKRARQVGVKSAAKLPRSAGESGHNVNALIRIHKAGTQKLKRIPKIQIISMANSRSRKSISVK
jgi:hypothetical protein